MKVIIVCGGKGTRLREETELKPKPMVEVAGLPILVHIMRIYSHYGHNDFILCLGYKAHIIKDYFLNLQKYTNDFSVDLATGEITYLNSLLNFTFKITFVETGDDTPSGQRVKIAVTKYVKDDEFLLTYGDGVSDIDVNESIRFHHKQSKKYGSLITISGVHPSSKYGKVHVNKKSIIKRFDEKPKLDDYINGGFMVVSRKVIKDVNSDDMIEDVLVKLTKKSLLSRYKHDGFWHSMDTLKDVIDLNKLWAESRPWAVWEKKRKP